MTAKLADLTANSADKTADKADRTVNLLTKKLLSLTQQLFPLTKQLSLLTTKPTTHKLLSATFCNKRIKFTNNKQITKTLKKTQQAEIIYWNNTISLNDHITEKIIVLKILVCIFTSMYMIMKVKKKDSKIFVYFSKIFCVFQNLN